MKRIILLLVFTLSILSAKSQIGIGAAIDYEMPLGELTFTYQPTIGYRFNVLKPNDEGVWNFSIGYHAFEPKADTFYYLINDFEYGIAEFNNYTVFPLNAGYMYKVPLIEDRLEFLVGIDIGYYYIFYKYKFKDAYSNLEGTEIEGKGDLSPKTGFSFWISKSLNFTIQSKFNFFFSLGSGDANSSDYNPNAGQSNISWSNGIGISYYFNK